MRGDNMKKTIQVLLPMELYEAVKEYAEKEHRTLSGQVRQILRVYMRDIDERVK